jgi:hypothetical protein
MNVLTTPVLDLLRDPSHWTKGSSARRPINTDNIDIDEEIASNIRKNGIPCPPGDSRATCWCLTGAIDRSHLPQLAFEIDKKLSAAIKELYPLYRSEMLQLFGPIGPNEPLLLCQYFNDHESTTHEMILRVLERAQV